MIAMGSENGCIYLFRVTRDGFSYKRQNKIRGTQPLQHIDWSVDGFFLQTVTVDFDLLFCKIFALFELNELFRFPPKANNVKMGLCRLVLRFPRHAFCRFQGTRAHCRPNAAQF